jgi:hypothetical protein
MEKQEGRMKQQDYFLRYDRLGMEKQEGRTKQQDYFLRYDYLRYAAMLCCNAMLQCSVNALQTSAAMLRDPWQER